MHRMFCYFTPQSFLGLLIEEILNTLVHLVWITSCLFYDSYRTRDDEWRQFAQVTFFTFHRSISISGTQVFTYENGANNSCTIYSQGCCQHQMINICKITLYSTKCETIWRTATAIIDYLVLEAYWKSWFLPI